MFFGVSTFIKSMVRQKSTIELTHGLFVEYMINCDSCAIYLKNLFSVQNNAQADLYQTLTTLDLSNFSSSEGLYKEGM